MTFLNQPAVKLDVKQSLPQCWLKAFQQQVLETSLSSRETKLIFHRINKKINKTLLQKSLEFNTHFLVHHLLLAPTKQEVESSHWTLSGCCMLSVLSEKQREGERSDLCVVVCVSRWCVRRRRWVGFDPSALHVRDELVGDLCQHIFSKPCHT